MIFIAFNHPHGAIQMRGCPIEISSEAAVAKSHAMTLDISFVNEIEPVAVTKIIPGRLVRVMRAAHGIDVELFHPLYISLHALDGDCLAAIGFELVPVDALDENPLAIDQ